MSNHVTDEGYRNAVRTIQRGNREDGIDALVIRHKLDALAGLPIGISFFGRAWSEPTLLRLAYAYEQAMRQRRPPAFKSSTDLHSR